MCYGRLNVTKKKTSNNDIIILGTSDAENIQVVDKQMKIKKTTNVGETGLKCEFLPISFVPEKKTAKEEKERTTRTPFHSGKRLQ